MPLLERKPGALRNGAPFKAWCLPKPIERVKAKLLKKLGGDRAYLSILQAMQHHGSEAVEVACDLALSDKTVSAPVILNMLSRLAPTATPQSIQTPVALKLAQEPHANCDHYNRLLVNGGENVSS